MNVSKLLLRQAAAALALCAGIIFIPAGRAQPETQIGGERYLFIFNTSADMKKRLPAVRTEVDQLLATSMGGHLRPGDSVGVWTFDQELHTGQFPLQLWRPEEAVTIAASINKFVGRQRYANRTRFSALQPQLNDVIQHSGQLTVLIFCDGEGEIVGTPYDADINRVFQLRQAEQKKALQPFVVVLRTQLGQYAGCTMNFPPGMVSIPEFPPLPAPPAPAVPVKTNPPPAPPPAPAAKPPLVGPPLIIIGTNVETGLPPATATATATKPVEPSTTILPPKTNAAPEAQTNTASPALAVLPAPPHPVVPKMPVAPPAPATPAPTAKTNAVSPPPTHLAPAAPAKPGFVLSSNSAVPANAVAPPAEAGSPVRKFALIGGLALLVVAGTLAALAVFRRRPDRGSLITRSMRKD